MAGVLVIVIAHNESERVGAVVREVREEAERLPVDLDVVVVDDGSTDGTAEQARKAGALVIPHPVNLKIGAAEQTGIMWALRRGYGAALRMDGDGQHPASAIGPLFEAVLGGGADLAVASRFLSGRGGYLSTPLRRLGIGYLSALVGAVAGKRVTDPTSGMRAFGPAAMRLLASIPASDYPEPESIIEARRAGLTVVEVPAVFRARASGTSSIGPWRAVYYMVKMTLAVLVAGIRGRRAVARNR